MSKSNSWENALMLLLFNNSNAANIGDATGIRGAVTAGNLYISLHTADPGETGDQTTSEANFTGYARVAVARSGSGFTITANQAVNANAITFNACTAGSNTVTHVGIGTTGSGAGVLLYSSALSASLAISNGITPEFAAGQLTITED